MIRLGKLALTYCKTCNLPLLKKTCQCGNIAEQVVVTPPGDIRPAFEFDTDLIRTTLITQFGDYYIPDVTLLNTAPDIDKKEEVIIDGKVAGNLVFDIIAKKFVFQCRPWYASLLTPKRGYVIADNGAVASILKSSNLMAPGVIKAHTDIKAGDELIVFNEDNKVIATGKARMDSSDMTATVRGMAVKIRNREMVQAQKGRHVTWDDVKAANRDVIQSMVATEKRFITKTIQNYKLPFVVSFSGGKDSLATLLLVIDAGFSPPLLFLNTGLEFDETVTHIYDIADRFDLELVEGQAGNKFWDSLGFFGIPAKDYRWCCKTCKLGVASLVIKHRFPDGVLSFIGQRRYESENRSNHGKVWKNPWVPNQIAASPIQNWTALHVWLYLFEKNVPWNRLYEQGLSRIGCWLCPASDLGEFAVKKHSMWPTFEKKLRAFSKNHQLPNEWVDLGLWRWRTPPRWSPVQYTISSKRVYKTQGKSERIKNFLKLCNNATNNEGMTYTIGDITVDLADDIASLEGMDTVKDIIYRAINCVGCGVCVAKCQQDAIHIKEGQAWIDSNCIQCMNCMDECPVLVFE